MDAIRSSSGIDDGLQHQAARRIQSAIEVDGRQDSLQGIHQQGGLVAAATLFFASPQVQVVSQLQFLGHSDQMLFADQVGPELGEFSLAKAGKAVEQFFGGDKSQDGVSQKLQLFVVSHPRPAGRLQRFQFARLGTVGQGLLQQFRPLEMVSQGRLAGAQCHVASWLVTSDDGPQTSDFGLQTVRLRTSDLNPSEV